MDGENNGKPYSTMDDFGVPLFLETPKRNSIFGNSQKEQGVFCFLFWKTNCLNPKKLVDLDRLGRFVSPFVRW